MSSIANIVKKYTSVGSHLSCITELRYLAARFADLAENGEYYELYRALSVNSERPDKELPGYDTFVGGDTYTAVDKAELLVFDIEDDNRDFTQVPVAYGEYAAAHPGVCQSANTFTVVFDLKKYKGHDTDFPSYEKGVDEVKRARRELETCLNWIGWDLDAIKGLAADVAASDDNIFFLSPITTAPGSDWELEFWAESSDLRNPLPRTYYHIVVPNAMVNGFIEMMPGRHYTWTSKF